MPFQIVLFCILLSFPGVRMVHSVYQNGIARSVIAAVLILPGNIVNLVRIIKQTCMYLFLDEYVYIW